MSQRKELLKLSKSQLIKKCKENNLNSTGNKVDMVERLISKQLFLKNSAQQNMMQKADCKIMKASQDNNILYQNRKIGRWFLGETLAKTEYSWIKKAYDINNGSVVALKLISNTQENWNRSQKKEIENEIDTLIQIKHPNVLQLLSYNLNAKYPHPQIPSLLFVYEYVNGGKLFDIFTISSFCSNDVFLTYFHQLIDGIEAIHQFGICHQNIHPQNLLLDNNFKLKITDFGIKNILENIQYTDTKKYDISYKLYQAPEILKGGEYTTTCDIFSCGVVLFILLCEYPPFESATIKCKYYAPMIKRKVREFWRQHRGCGVSVAARDLITRMIWHDFNKRISIRGIKKHKWYDREMLSSEELKIKITESYRYWEIMRREDEKIKTFAGKINKLVNHPKQSMNSRIWNHYYTPTVHEKKMQKLLGYRRQEYYEGDAIDLECIEIETAYLKSEDGDRWDCLDVLVNDYVSKHNEIKIDYLVNDIVNKARDFHGLNVESHWLWHRVSLMYIDITLRYNIPQCIAPQLPWDESATLRDIYSTRDPKDILQGIREFVEEIQGAIKTDFSNATMQLTLATAKFPKACKIKVSVFSVNNVMNCNLVKFQRMEGDILHFGRCLKLLIKECGHILTGLPPFLFPYSEMDKQRALELFYNAYIPSKQKTLDIVFGFIHSKIENYFNLHIPLDIKQLIYMFWNQINLYKIGDVIDARDKSGIWRKAWVKKHKSSNQSLPENEKEFVEMEDRDKYILINLEGVYVHYVGMTAKNDEWIFVKNEKYICHCHNICKYNQYDLKNGYHRLTKPNKHIHS